VTSRAIAIRLLFGCLLLGPSTAAQTAPPGNAPASPPLSCAHASSLFARNPSPMRPDVRGIEGWIQSEVAALASEEHVAASAVWIDGNFAQASGTDILVGRDLAAKIEALNIAPDRRQLVWMYILAHEFGHLIQGFQASPDATRARELEADILAGSWCALRAQPGTEPTQSMWNPARYAYTIGDANWQDKGSHGSPGQRKEAFVVGFMGLQGTARKLGASMPGDHRLSYMRKKFARAVDMLVATQTQDEAWENAFDQVYLALSTGQSPPTTPTGVTAQANGPAAWSYVFRPANASPHDQDPTTTLWTELENRIKGGFGTFPEDVAHHLHGHAAHEAWRQKHNAAIDSDDARARAVLNDAGARVRRRLFLQEAPAGGLRVSLTDLERTDAARSHRLVLSLSQGPQITAQDREAALQDRIADDKAEHDLDAPLTGGDDDESLSDTHQRHNFFVALGATLKGATTELPGALDHLSLPSGVRRGAHATNERTYVFADTAVAADADAVQRQLDYNHLQLTLPDSIVRSDDPDVDDETKAVPFEAVGVPPAGDLRKHAVFVRPDSKLRVGLGEGSVPAGSGARYWVVVYVTW